MHHTNSASSPKVYKRFDTQPVMAYATTVSEGKQGKPLAGALFEAPLNHKKGGSW
jgi:hypothetical protein